MKALTVRQPWAWAIVHGGKDIENRGQAWTYRGPLLIHAAHTYDEPALNDTRIRDVAKAAGWAGADPEPATEVGVFLGVTQLVDAHPCAPGCCRSAWADRVPGVVHLVLADPRPLPRLVPCRGRLGLWTPPAAVVTMARSVA